MIPTYESCMFWGKIGKKNKEAIGNYWSLSNFLVGMPF